MSPESAPPKSLAEAVREHLLLLFNTRQGSVPHLPEYGLPDLSEYYKGFPDSLDPLGRAIRRTVETYEPRLLDVKVSLVSAQTSYFGATFTIEGVLESEDEATVKFQTVVAGGSPTEVKI